MHSHWDSRCGVLKKHLNILNILYIWLDEICGDMACWWYTHIIDAGRLSKLLDGAYFMLIYSPLGMVFHHQVIRGMIEGKPGIRLWRHFSSSERLDAYRAFWINTGFRTGKVKWVLKMLLFYGRNLSCGRRGSRKPGNKEISIIWYGSGTFSNT